MIVGNTSSNSQITIYKSQFPLVLYGHDECSLCDRLERLIEPHLQSGNLKLVKKNIKDDPELTRRYGTRIPVLTYNGRVLVEGNPPPQQIIEALQTITF